MRFFVGLLLSYLLVCALVFAVQRRLLYLPATGPGSFDVSPSIMAPWPDNGSSYLGFLGAQTAASPLGTMVVFHGNAGSAVHRGYYPRALERLGFRVIVAEYPGYGRRPGAPSESALVDAAVELIDVVKDTFGDPVYLWGESLGAGVAAAVATQVRASGVVLLTPWHTLPEMAQSVYWFLPARWLVLDQYDNSGNLQGYEGPVAVVLAERDEIIPPHHGQKLFDSLGTAKRLWRLRGAGHNSWPTNPGSPWWEEVVSFITSHAHQADARVDRDPPGP